MAPLGRKGRQSLGSEHRDPDYWIVNIADRQVELYRSPVAAEARYLTRTVLEPGAQLRMDLAEDVSIDIEADALLP